MESIFAQTDTVLIICNKNFEIIFANSSCEDVFLTSKSKIINKELYLFLDNFKQVHDLSIKSLDTGISYKLHDCSIRNQYYSISIKSITYNSQTSFLYEIFNTSMKKEIEEQHKLINHENSYHELLRNLAHEIKNPLGAMKGSAQLLERKTDFQYHEYTNLIINETNRLKDLIDNLLSPYKKRTTMRANIHEIIERVIKTILVEYPEVKFIRKYDVSIPEILCDPSQVYQAIFNLILNGVQSTEENCKITLNTKIKINDSLIKKNASSIEVMIKDNGSGIEINDFDKIFEPLYTTKKNGSGLGLSLSRSLIYQNDGVLNLVNSDSFGTQFQISLPNIQ
jgi:two-component system nitrogen regulation sensor histidine kinase GlnL